MMARRERMKLAELLAIKSTVSLTVGLILVLVPGAALTIVGVPNNEPSGLFFIAQLYGAMLFFLGLLLWFTRGRSETDILGVIIPPVVIGDAIGFFILLGGVSSRMMNGVGELILVLHFCLTLGLGAFWLPWFGARAQTRRSS
jgi:hypothetical protein